jgi:hypothetical protein
MKLWVTGSQDWDNDMVLARAVTLVLQELNPEDKNIMFIHTDREGAEQMFGSYVAKTKNFLSGKGFKVSEFIPNRSLQFADKLYKILDQSPDLLLIFNKGADFKAGKTKDFARSNSIKVVEHKNS